MAATAGYQAGVEANQTRISYAMEVTWGVAPAVQFQAIRYMSDTLAETKTRQRPSEINITREASQAVTTQQTGGGTINYALSYGTYDDFFSVALQQDWQALQTINGIAADITLTNTAGTVVLSSTLTSKYTTINQGQWIRLLGFTNATNNGWWYVSIKTDNSHLTLLGATRTTSVTETPTGTLAKVRSSTIGNGTTFKSMFMQQKLSNSMFLVYPGSYVSRMTISGSIGNFFTGAIDIIARNEANAAVDASTGATLAAPTNIVMDPVNGFGGCYWNGSPMVGTLDQVAITLENTGAAPEYGLGSQNAVGILGGTFSASGSFRMYFNDFTNYGYFQAETPGILSFIMQSGASGNSYAFTFPNAILMEKVNAGGPGQPVYADITFEANPQAAGGTVIIDRMVNV